MNKPLDDDFNYKIKPREAKGGTFAPADMPLIKEALQSYLSTLVETEESEREPSDKLVKVANLLHRIGRIG